MFKKLAQHLLKEEANENLADFLSSKVDKLIHNENDRRNTAEILDIVLSGPKKELKVPPEKIHHLTSKPRGYCLVINVFQFKGETGCRVGSDKDFSNVTKLWTQLGYQVTAYQNKSKRIDGYSPLTRTDINQLVQDFARMECHKDVDSSAVIIMTHGTVDHSNPKAVSLFGSDMRVVNTEQLIDHFNLMKCPHLAHKPKFFFFQACRGRFENKTRLETDSETPLETDSVTPLETDSETPLETDDVNANAQDGAHSLTYLLDSGNQLIVFPSAPGFRSIRDPAGGSWFIQAMCHVFQEKAYNTDILTMLDLVSDYVKEEYINKQESDVVVSQVLCVEKRGFDKYVFFGP